MKKNVTAISSDRRAAANKENAEKSTGPRTESGKARARMNAIRHGLSGRTVVLPTEDLAVYQKFAKEIVDSFQPETPFERQLAQTVADCQWRLNRARSIEEGMLAIDNAEPGDELDTTLNAARTFRETSHAFLNLSTYEQRLSRQLDRALRQLMELREKREAGFYALMDRAIMLDKQHKMLGEEWDPAEDGFVYSRDRIRTENRRRVRLENARSADFCDYRLNDYLQRCSPVPAA